MTEESRIYHDERTISSMNGVGKTKPLSYKTQKLTQNESKLEHKT